jgi:hypothetical protein
MDRVSSRARRALAAMACGAWLLLAGTGCGSAHVVGRGQLLVGVSGCRSVPLHCSPIAATVTILGPHGPVAKRHAAASGSTFALPPGKYSSAASGLPPKFAGARCISGVGLVLHADQVTRGGVTCFAPTGRAFAGKVNLSASDAPGFKVVADTEGQNEAGPGPLTRPLEECDRGPLLNSASRGVASPLLQTQSVPIQTVVSAVYPTSNRSVASEYIAAADGRRGMGCILRDELRKRRQVAGRVARERVEVTALRAPLLGAPVHGVRIWSCLPGSRPCGSRSVRSFKDRLWFAAGPYVVTLGYIAGPQNEAKTSAPVALPIERRLIALLYSRTQAHKS